LYKKDILFNCVTKGEGNVKRYLLVPMSSFQRLALAEGGRECTERIKQ
jgi:hypothetical protein